MGKLAWFALVLAAVSCCGGNGVGEPSPTAYGGTPPEYSTLVGRMVGGSFSVLFEGEASGVRGQVLWRHTPAASRWDTFGEGATTNLWETSVTIKGELTRFCAWHVEDSLISSPRCGLGEGFGYEEIVTYGLNLPQLHFSQADELVGEQIFCFESEPDFRADVKVCLTSNGVPLVIVARFGVYGPISLRAVDIWPSPDSSEIRVLPERVLTEQLMSTWLDDLGLPRLPAAVAVTSPTN
jgi:hypothetical protein